MLLCRGMQFESCWKSAKWLWHTCNIGGCINFVFDKFSLRSDKEAIKEIATVVLEVQLARQRISASNQKHFFIIYIQLS